MLPSHGRNERRWWLVLVTLIVCLDCLLLIASAFTAYNVRFGSSSVSSMFTPERAQDFRPYFYAKLTLIYVSLSVLICMFMGAYQRRNILHGVVEFQQVLYATGLSSLLTEFASYLSYRHYPIARGWLLLTWLLGTLFVMLGRFAGRRALQACHRIGILVQTALVVGIGREGQILEWHIDRAREEGIRVIGYVDDEAPLGHEVAGGLKVLGHIDDLPGLIRRYQVGQVLVATADLSHEDALRVMQQVLPTPAEFLLAPDLFRTLTTAGHLRRIGGDPLLAVDKMRITGVNALLKNTLDVAGATILLVVTLPVWLVIAIILKISSPGPILARYSALGAGGRPFTALKFRTTRYVQSPDTDDETRDRLRRGLPIRGNPNVTPFGRFLIRFSLDELPQLLNVLVRQMSLVGPYKISPDQISLYGSRHLALFTVRPGITGVCQIHGRGELTIEERSLLDAEYVRTYSIWRDAQIVMSSIPTVLHGRGAY